MSYTRASILSFLQKEKINGPAGDDILSRADAIQPPDENGGISEAQLREVLDNNVDLIVTFKTLWIRGDLYVYPS